MFEENTEAKQRERDKHEGKERICLGMRNRSTGVLTYCFFYFYRLTNDLR